MVRCGENDFVNGFKTKYHIISEAKIYNIALNCLKNDFMIKSDPLIESRNTHPFAWSQVSYCKDKQYVVGFKFQLDEGFFGYDTNIKLRCEDGLYHFLHYLNS